jgi:hypothetical protein
MSRAHRRLIYDDFHPKHWLRIPPLWESAYSPHHALPPAPAKEKDKGKPRPIAHTTRGPIAFSA